MLTVGDTAPDFTLTAHTGAEIRLSDYRGKRHVVLVFYPLDFSPVCSVQLPEYSDLKDDFGRLDAVVLGVNRDSVYTHRAWAEAYGIEVPLLADMTLAVARAFGVDLPDEGTSQRAVFLVDRAGTIRLVHVEKATGDFTLHAAEVLELLRDLPD